MASTTDTSKVLVRAEAKWVRMSARKARIVLEHIRGRSVPEARTVLVFTQRAAAREIEKVLRSAVANAESAHGFDGDELVVEAAYADEGPDPEALACARARPRESDPQAHVPYHGRPRVADTARSARSAARHAGQAEAPSTEPVRAKPKRGRRRRRRQR